MRDPSPSTVPSSGIDVGSPESVYDCRWSAGEMRAKDGVWREIARYLQRYVPVDGVVLDIAADRGHFITNIAAGEKWASDLRDTSAHLPDDVRFVKSDGLELDANVPNAHFDVAFMSNYLEHLPSSDAVVAQMHVVRKLLKPTGRMIVLQPNIRHVGGEYWDFIDHHVALTERSLVEAGSLAGFRTVALKSRFLPYSFRSRMPSHRLLVRAYLAFPPAWRILGKQTLYVAEPI
jgi:SAM-dependent methyltransferase